MQGAALKAAALRLNLNAAGFPPLRMRLLLTRAWLPLKEERAGDPGLGMTIPGSDHRKVGHAGNHHGAGLGSTASPNFAASAGTFT